VRSSATLPGWKLACPCCRSQAFLPCSSAGQSCVIGCHCLFRKWQGGALISSRSTAQPLSWAESISVSSPSCWPWQSQTQRQAWGKRTSGSPGREGSFCSFGNLALWASPDPLLSHLRSDARKVGGMQGSVGETPGVMGSAPVWNQLRGST